MGVPNIIVVGSIFSFCFTVDVFDSTFFSFCVFSSVESGVAVSTDFSFFFSRFLGAIGINDKPLDAIYYKIYN
jgi:glycosylphosphatidylinositol transamidase (GPIT) subunit GPI8